MSREPTVWGSRHCINFWALVFHLPCCIFHQTLPFVVQTWQSHFLMGYRQGIDMVIQSVVISMTFTRYLCVCYMQFCSQQFRHLCPAFSKGFWCPSRGTRFGEALNPGPKFNIALTNPTAILNKQQTYQELLQLYNLHAIAAAETSATELAQRVMSNRFRQMGLHTQWSTPVADQFPTVSGQPSFRGKAAGVCLATRFPCRQALDTISVDWQTTSRILHVVISLGTIEVQIVVIYGIPLGQPNATQINSDLVLQAMQATNCLSLPSIILGDFNANPHSLPCHATIVQQGFYDLKWIHQERYGTPYPFTCKDATSPDTALVSSGLLPLLKTIIIHPDYVFDAHKPVILCFEMEAPFLTSSRLVMPKSWLELPIESEFVQTTYPEIIQTQGIPNTLEEWALGVEDTIDRAYRLSQQKHSGSAYSQTTGLPYKFRGRCQPGKMHSIPPKTLTKLARPGDYNPATEVYRFSTLKCVRQMRRLQSLQRRLKKGFTPQQVPELQQEWHRICRDRSFGDSFVFWCQSHPDIGPLPRWLPSHDFVWHVEQILRHETDMLLAEDAKIWRRKQEYFRQLDGQHQGFSQAFKLLKSKPSATLSAIQEYTEVEAHFVHEEPYGTMFLEVDHGLQPNQPASFCGHTCHIVDSARDFVTISTPHEAEQWPPEGPLSQTKHYSTPAQMFGALSAFWTPLWQRPLVEEAVPDLHPFLSNLPSDFPEVSIDLTNPQLWVSAVRSLKPSSGRGVDAISAAELQSLPDLAIHHLGRVLASYTSGFPEWLMLARTVALPKVPGFVKSSQIRPITIMAQTYRLWSKVVCQVILRHFSSLMPVEITGLLKNRGPLDAAYRAQLLHEIALQQGVQEGGFSLDLLKCFNTIGQPQAISILEALNVPSSILKIWKQSIQHLKRYWDLGSNHSTIISCTNGVPEGDTFSVVVMVAVAFTWVCSIKTVAPATRIGAYADNWGWATRFAQDHAAIFSATVRFVQAMGMEIDWQKSWYWSTDHRHQAAILRALQQHTIVKVTKVAHAQDLGCTMTYHGPPRYTSTAKRFAEGKKRLGTLASMPHSFETKCHLSNAGVVPVVMMGVEFVPIQPSTFVSFRSALANAVLGESVSRNSAMAISCSPLLIDPEVEATLRSIRALKKFLANASGDEIAMAFRFLARHNGNAKLCQGPLGTLKNYLQRFGWQVLPDGKISVSSFVALSLRFTGMTVFKIWLIRSWQVDLAAFYSNRQSWQNLPAIDLHSTRQILATFSSSYQTVLLNEISVAYQTATQQQAWDANIDGKCKYCGQEDTRFHRVYTCSATADCRCKHKQLLDELQEMQSPLHELPVLFQQPNADCIHTIHEHQLAAQCSESTLQKLNGLPYRIHCYTDGSCHHPSSPNTRYASFSVIVDICSSDADRQHEATRWLATRATPPTLLPLLLSRLPGIQVIHRAELYAVVCVTEHLHSTQTHTDSGYVMAAVQKCLAAQHSQQLEMLDDADLLVRLWQALRRGDHRITKIKAHTNPGDECDPLLRYHLLGNQRANDLAIWTNKHLLPTLVQEFDLHHQSFQTDKDRLLEFYHLQIKLNLGRAKLEAAGLEHLQSRVVSTQQRHSSLETLQQWKISQAWTPPAPTMDLSSHSVWGKTLTLRLLQWLSQLRWPSNLNAPDEFGVTWLELACSFWQTVGCFIPVKRKDQQSVWRVVPIDDYAQAQLHQVKFSEQAKMLSQWIDQVSDLIDSPVIPKLPRGLVRSLYTLGAGIQSSGIQYRPEYPYQDTTVLALRQFFLQHKSQAMTALPSFDLSLQVSSSDIRNELGTSWDARAKDVHTYARQIRDWRKCPQRKLCF